MERHAQLPQQTILSDVFGASHILICQEVVIRDLTIIVKVVLLSELHNAV
jgi:hypothetical protein